MKNGTERPLLAQILDIVESHMSILALESRWEVTQATRRLAIVAASLLLITTAFLLAQIGLVFLLVKSGMSMIAASFLLSMVYLLAAGLLLWKWGRRDLKKGTFLQGTREEMSRTFQWLRNEPVSKPADDVSARPSTEETLN